MQSRHERWLDWMARAGDGLWGAAQLLGVFFLGSVILCVPPRLHSAPATLEPDRLPIRVASTGHEAHAATLSENRLLVIPIAEDHRTSSR